MNAAIAAGCTAVAALAVLVLFWIARELKPPYLGARWDEARQDWVNEDEHDVGPDNLRLLEETDADLNAQLGALFERLGPPDFHNARKEGEL